MKRIVFGLLFIFTIFVVSAVPNLPSNLEISQLADVLEQIDCQSIKLVENTFVGQEIPEKVPYKNEIFNLYILENYLGTLIIEDSIVSEYNCEETNERTYDVFIQDYSVFLEFSEGFSADKLNEMIASKQIQIKGVGIGKKLKWFFSKIALKWFG